MLNTRGRQKVKEIVNSYGLRFLNLTNQDVLAFQLSNNMKQPTSFFNSLNKIGIQYKTIQKEKGKWLVQLWPKGERPSMEKTKGTTKNNKKSDNPNRSNYIKRIARKLRKIAEEYVRPRSETSINVYDALSKEEGQKEALLIIKRKLEKEQKENISKSDFIDWLNEELTRKDRVINSLNESFKKLTRN